MHRRTVLAGAAAGAVAAVAGPFGMVGRAQEAATGAAANAVDTEVAISYGVVEGQPLLLDVYRPPAREALRPAVLVFHPGAMITGDRSWMTEEARALAAAGYVAFSVGYRLFDGAERHRWPAQLDDAQRAVRWVRANAARYGVDPARVGAYGYSAGGTLAAHLATRETRDNADPALAGESSRVACAVDIVGEADPTIPAPNPQDSARIAAFLGGTPASAPATYRDFSALTHVDAKTAPFLVFHGTRDSWTPVDHARRLVAALHAAAVEVVYVEFPLVGHLDWSWGKTGPWTLLFLELHLRPDA